jgi:hypothetical protein
MTWTELFLGGIVLLFLGLCFLGMTWISDPKTRKEAGVKLQGDPSDEEEISFARVEDFDDPNEHPDQWSEKITVPARGRRPEMVIIIRNSEMEYDEESEVVSDCMVVCSPHQLDSVVRLNYGVE